jgi:hypothetical protein
MHDHLCIYVLMHVCLTAFALVFQFCNAFITTCLLNLDPMRVSIMIFLYVSIIPAG